MCPLVRTPAMEAVRVLCVIAAAVTAVRGLGRLCASGSRDLSVLFDWRLALPLVAFGVRHV